MTVHRNFRNIKRGRYEFYNALRGMPSLAAITILHMVESFEVSLNPTDTT
jgi:hypothetical protein